MNTLGIPAPLRRSLAPYLRGNNDTSIDREMRDALALYERRTGRSATALERAEARGAAVVIQVMESVR